MHTFLVNEDYWFDIEMPDREENARVLGTIQEWQRHHNVFKQRGFYVDVTEAGEPITPQEVADPEAVRAVIGHVHQIGWQLRLGEHIEGKSQLQRQQDVPPASEEEIENTRRHMRSVDPDIVERIVESMRDGTKGEKLNNAGYAFVLPEDPFGTVGRPGHEAQDRELWALMNEPSESGDKKPEG